MPQPVQRSRSEVPRPGGGIDDASDSTASRSALERARHGATVSSTLARPASDRYVQGDGRCVSGSWSGSTSTRTRVADLSGFERFHLVGYSGGGAASLAYTVEHPERLLSLALMEPAFAGWQRMTPAERSNFERFRPLLSMDGPEQMARFQALQLAPGVVLEPPPPGPPPPWMSLRPAGVRALLATFLSSDMDLDALRSFDRPVWFALGGLSHPDYYARIADRLAGVFPDFTLEVFPNRHHFDPPHRIEPHRVAASLRSLWSRAERQLDRTPAK